nr:hypothetical protein [Tanacetum cinerariifolium]
MTGSNFGATAGEGLSGIKSFVILIKQPTFLNDPLRTVLSVETQSRVIIVKDVLLSERHLRKIFLHMLLNMELSKILLSHPMTIPMLLMLLKSHSLSITTPCTCKLCGNGAHYVYNCPPKVPIIPNPEPFNNQTIKKLPPTVQSFDTKPDLVHKSPNVFNPPSQLPFISCEFCRNDARYGHYCTPQEEEKKIEEAQAANARNWKIPACYDDDDDYNFAIIPNKPDDSLSMGDEHLDTVPATKSDKFIKSSVENLVPIPSESEGESEYVSKKIFSNPLFEEEITPMKIDQHHYNVESDLIESLCTHDSSISISSKIDSLLEEFAGELTLLKSIPHEIDETDCNPEEEIRLIERLFDSLMEEIDLTFTPDYPMPPGIEDDEYESERDILILKDLPSNDTLSLPEIESFYFDIPSFSRPPSKPPDAGSESRPSMLNKENYVPWSSRLLRYAKSRPNGKLIHNSIINGPYVRRMIPNQIEADDQAIQTILLGLPEDIYAAVDELKAERLAKTQDPLALMANSNNPYVFLAPHQDEPSFNQNYMQQPMPNPEDITDPTTAINMALVLMAKAFKLNYSTPTNNNQRISSNPRNRQIAQLGMYMGQDRQMQIVKGTGENQLDKFEWEWGVGHYARNCTVRPRRRDVAYLQTQLLVTQKEEARIQLQAEEFDLMAAAADLDEIEEVNANCILMANLQQASTSGTQSDKAPVYDSDGSAEVHDYENNDDNEIFNMFTQEEQYTKLLEPIPDQHQVPMNDNNVISK